VAQRLVKVLCPGCKAEVPVGEEERRLLSEPELARLKRVYRSAGCRECHQTGYTGRQPVFEVMPIQTPGMRQVILTENSGDRIAEQAVREGMVSLREAALDLVARGETSLPEALKIILVE
jgi:type II secretory ATPase GspE/PulE/Tfp pilus assembly ATPase PilB-like protein